MTDLLFPVALLALGAATPTLRTWTGRSTGWLLGAIVAAIGATMALPAGPGIVRESAWSWIPSMGVELAVRVDGLASTFVLLVAGIGALVLVYAEGYLAGDPRLGRLQGTLLAFLGAMLGLVVADDLIALFVFWELTSVCSFLLIGFDHTSEASRRSALQALLVTGAGGLALLAGLLTLRAMAIDLGLDPGIASRVSSLAGVDLAQHALYPLALGLVLAGAFTKSAQFPFHFWLPNAMTAPTPVSAFLHSATMVKAGVFLLARLHPALGDTALWHVVVTGAGAVTMLLGAVLAVGQRDLKRILAYSTVSVLGTLTMLLGAGTEVAIKAAVVFLVAHALYKAALFLVAGSLDHETGTRDVKALSGLRAAMPYTAAAGVLAALSKAGAPPMFGFVGKELLYKAKLDLESVAAWLVLAAVVANVALVATALAVGVRPFFGARRDTPRPAHEVPWSMRLGPVVLAGLGVFVGMVPGVFDRTLGSAMASSIVGRPVTMELKLWYGVSPSALAVLALSVATLALGALLFRRLSAGRSVVASASARLAPIGPGETYVRLVEGLPGFAAAAVRPLQSGYLRRYVALVLLVAVAASAPWLVPVAADLATADGPWPGALDALLAGLALAGAIVTVRTRSRLAAVAALGVTGVAVSGLFALHSALDVAATQLAVETLTVVLFVLLFRGLPRTKVRRRTAGRAATAAVAAAGGVLLGALAWAATALRQAPDAARYFAETAATEAYGRNVVNVILVDFRALDTLGEIVVVAAAGVGVLVLARVRATLLRKEKA